MSNLTEENGKDYGYAIADYSVTFSDVENLEKKRSNFNQEAKAIHEATVGQWNKIYEELRKLVDTYSGSPAFQESKLGNMFAKLVEAKETS